MNFASKSVIYENPLGSFTCRKAGTWDILFYFPSEGRHTEDFPDARKIQRLQPGLNPRTQVPVASMLTTRPPKPSLQGCWGQLHVLSDIFSHTMYFFKMENSIEKSRCVMRLATFVVRSAILTFIFRPFNSQSQACRGGRF